MRPLMLPSNYTIRTELINRENSKGFRPVKIIVTIKGKRTLYSTGVRIKESDWNKDASEVRQSNKMHRSYNAIISSKKVEIETSITDKIRAGESLSISTLKSPKNYKLIPYMEEYIERSRTKYKLGTHKRYKVELERLRKFSPDITFASLDHHWLRKYEDHLRKTPSERTEKLISNNTIHGCFKVLRRVFNAAIRDGITKNYPFHQYENPKYNKTNPVYLTAKELEKFEAALKKPMSDIMYRSGKYFLLGCYSGLRVSDWLRFNKEFVQGDRLVLRAKKNGELVAMKMHSKLKVLVKELLKLPPSPVEQKLNIYIRSIAKMAGIKKHLHTHCARHGFAVHCATIGISQESTAELMGITIATCGVYYRITGSKLDSEVAKWDE